MIHYLKSNLVRIFRDPDSKGPILRLCLMAVVMVAGLVLTVCCLPPITQGLGAFLEGILLGFTCTVMCMGLSWGFAKWAAFIFPKSFALANYIWENLFAWSIFGLAIKAMIWLYLLILPAALYGAVLLPVGLVVYGLSLLGSGFLSTALLVLFFVGAVCLLATIDVCSLMEWTPKKILRSVFGGAAAMKAR